MKLTHIVSKISHLLLIFVLYMFPQFLEKETISVMQSLSYSVYISERELGFISIRYVNKLMLKICNINFSHTRAYYSIIICDNWYKILLYFYIKYFAVILNLTSIHWSQSQNSEYDTQVSNIISNKIKNRYKV